MLVFWRIWVNIKHTNNLEFTLVFDHLNIIRDEAHIVLDFQAWMAGIF